MQIQLASFDQAIPLYNILQSCRRWLDKNGIPQWTDNYPTIEIVMQDIMNRQLYCYAMNGIIIGMITINDLQDEEYAALSWKDNEGRAMVIHRLAVEPMYQGAGIARMLMDFAEEMGALSGYSSVRLDAFTENKRVLKFYEKRGYEKRGEVFFPYRDSPFNCYEKSLLIK